MRSGRYPNWRDSDAEHREVRKAVTFAIYTAMDEVARIVENPARCSLQIESGCMTL